MDPLAGHSLVLRDLEHGNGKWRNISGIIRYTFRALLQTVDSQQARIAALEAALTAKASNDDVERLASLVPTTKYVEAQVGELQRQLSNRVSHADLAAAVESNATDRAAAASHSGDLLRKLAAVETEVEAHRRELGEVQTSLRSKVGADELAALPTLADLQSRASVAEVNSSLKHKANKDTVDRALASKAARTDLTALQADVEAKASKLEVVEFVESKVAAVHAQLSALQKSVEEEVQRVHRATPFAVAADVESALARKADKADLAGAVRSAATMSALEARLASTASELHAALSKEFAREVQAVGRETYRELVSVLNRKAYKSDVHRLLQAKADKDEVAKVLDRKADKSNTADALSKLASKRDLKHALESEASGMGEGWRGKLVKLEAAVARKIDSAAVEAALLLKADITDLARVRRDAALGAPHAPALSAGGASPVRRGAGAGAGGGRPATAAAGAPGGSVYAAGPCGRWVWKSHRKSGTSCVPWEVQAINTEPTLLVWRPGSDSITAARPGLYEISLGFFCGEAVRVSVLVNGDPIFTAPGDAEQVVHHVHPAGSITGTTVVQFVTLPARAQVAVTVDGDSPSQGFLNLRKL